MTVSDFLQACTIKFGNKIAIKDVSLNNNYTYNEIRIITKAATYWLQKKEIKKGDRICILSKVCPEAIFLFWAAASLGVITIFLDNATGIEPLKYIIQETKPRLILSHIESLSMFNDAGLTAEDMEQLLFLKSQKSSERFLALNTSIQCIEEDKPTANDPAIIIYTSGSTGNPKGVTLSHASLCRSGKLLSDFFQWNDYDVFLNLGTLHTMSGLRNTCITPFVVGSSIILGDAKQLKSVFTIIELIQKNNVTILGCVPIFLHHLKILGNKLNDKNLKSLKMILSTGSMLDSQLVHWIYQNFSVPVLNYYGLTETTGFCAGQTLTSFLNEPQGIGVPVGATFEIVNENGDVLGDDQPGELIISGPNLMLGYYRQPELTSSVIREGKFYTGDLALRKPDGTIFLVGRKNNMIKNIFSEVVHFEEVEQAIQKHPKILEAGVTSLPSEFSYEKLVALVVPLKPLSCTAVFVNSLKDFLRTQLGANKIPDKIFVVDKLPRTSSGKLMRKELIGLLNALNISK